MTLEGAEGRIWCSKIGWQTVPCSWSIDGEAALTGPGTRDQQSPQKRWNAVRQGIIYTPYWGWYTPHLIDVNTHPKLCSPIGCVCTAV